LDLLDQEIRTKIRKVGLGDYFTDTNHIVRLCYDVRGLPTIICLTCVEIAKLGENVLVKTLDMGLWEWALEFNEFQDRHGKILLDGAPLGRGTS
jgi:hypothetical protein